MQTLCVLALFLGQVFISTTAEKVGICKPAPAYGPCVITCGADENCDGISKCCSNGCGAWCSEPTCPQGQTKVDCPVSLCNYAGCPGKPQESVRCSVDFCNQCKVSFHNVSTGDPVDCGPVETLCPRMLAATNQQQLLGQYRPKCDQSGAFEKVQCHEGYCFCVDTRSGVPDMSTSVRGKPKCAEKTLCQKQVDEAMKLPPIGRFVPKCKSDGSFQEKQCHASTGQCWCVDSYGREWFGTRSRTPTLDCTASVCPTGVTQLKCDPMICHTAKCPGYEKALCRVNPCGQCKPEFLDQYNRKIKCLTKCQSLRNEALGLDKPNNGSVVPVVGRYIPQCTSEGKFQQVQCYGSTGYCWCVDNEGSPVLGTIVRGMPHCNSSDVGVCPAGKPMFTCLRDLCKWSSCPAYPNAKCRVNPCGFCKAEFLDNNGNVIKDCNNGLTQCQQERAKALQAVPGGLQPVGRFVPECVVNGSYKQVQCWGSIGFCWCVDNKGKEVIGTRVRGQPDCSKVTVKVVKDGFCPFKQPRGGKLFCSSAKKCTSDGNCGEKDKCCNSTCGPICQTPIFTACPNGRPFLLCLHMCNFAKCPGNPKAQCFSDPCKMCRVEFRDSNGNPVDCSKGLSSCQLRRQQAMGLLGAFRPRCDDQGNYEHIQQHEGYYWCVDSKGRELPNTRTRFTKPKKCPNVGPSSMTLCQLQSQKVTGGPPLVGRYAPQCENDGSFSQVQCHPSTGYCWCVNTTTGVIVPNTQKRGQPDCNRACKPYMCRMYCEYGFVKDQFGCDICKCASAPKKPGFCPAVKPQQVGACVENCTKDDDCTGSSKCCSNGCGHVCTSAVLRAKPGVCPHRRIDHVGVCMNKCGDDKECPGDQKCCSNGCGKECSAPVREACPYGQPFVMCLVNPCQHASCPSNPKARCRPNYCGGCKAEFFDENNKMVKCTSGVTECQRKYLEVTSKGPLIGAYIPQCDKNGAFSPMQCHGSSGYCWCVDLNTGKEIENTKKGPGQGRPSCLTECQRKKLEVTSKRPLIGAYIPQCDKNGAFSAMQCHASTGHCWCVDLNTGKEIENTKKGPGQGQPSCKTTSITGPTCSSKNKRFSLCEGSLCKSTNCTRYPRARCVVPMGTCDNMCQPKHYDYDGSEVECRTECEQKALETTQAGLLGAYKPSCNPDGTYTLIQCHTSTGYCWCSSPDGKEWPGTRTRGQPKCLRSRSELEITKVHVKLTFKKDFKLVNESLKEFITVLKSQLSQRLGIKVEQITQLSVTSGSIKVEFYVVPASGGKDINGFAQHIYDEVRREDIVVKYAGTEFVASPQQVQATSNYLTEDQPSKQGGLGATSVALICVFIALTVVIIAIVVIIVKKRRRRYRSNTDTDQTAGFLYKDGRAESYSTTSAIPTALS